MAWLRARGDVGVGHVVEVGTGTLIANATTNICAGQTLAALNIADGVEVTFGDGLPFVGGPGKIRRTCVSP